MHNGEVLRFEKSLEMAQKQLRETNSGPLIATNVKQEADLTTKANIPLTETTKRLSQQERTNGESGGAMEPDSPTRSRYDRKPRIQTINFFKTRYYQIKPIKIAIGFLKRVPLLLHHLQER